VPGTEAKKKEARGLLEIRQSRWTTVVAWLRPQPDVVQVSVARKFMQQERKNT
jgi:hypothetical protein